jgi:hypothetical protein
MAGHLFIARISGSAIAIRATSGNQETFVPAWRRPLSPPLPKSPKHCSRLIGGNANAGIPYVDPLHSMNSPASDKHATSLCIADRIGQQIADYARHDHSVGVRENARIGVA